MPSEDCLVKYAKVEARAEGLAEGRSEGKALDESSAAATDAAALEQLETLALASQQAASPNEALRAAGLAPPSSAADE